MVGDKPRSEYGPWQPAEHVLAFGEPAMFDVDPGAGPPLLEPTRLPGPTYLPPNGHATVTVSFLVWDEAGRPVSNIPVAFGVSFGHPSGKWRTIEGMVEIYLRNRCDDPERIRRLIRNGNLRLLGTVRPATSSTDNDGRACTVYRASHIGGDFDQSAMALEFVTATLPNGVSLSVKIGLGHQSLVPVPEIPGGLRVRRATGRHVRDEVREFLEELGQHVAGSGWPQPVTVRDASLRWGGLFPPHMTHMHGASLDIQPMSYDGEPTWAKSDGTAKANYDRAQTRQLAQLLAASGPCAIYFNDPQIIEATPLRAHDDHLHVNWMAADGALQVPQLDRSRASKCRADGSRDRSGCGPADTRASKDGGAGASDAP